ncbi:hypothetical protein [Phenylobacterium immobile]|uniref:hypothetical protein n=1 Tax=Phenylobacterium immobile TaxID=21 RepID=UPI000AA65E86|nr:hypothetical protein [Phenylobacterium immobile]
MSAESYIVSLVNPGLIPIEAVTTMGVSAKEGDNPIGFFGTGLKYAIAGLLRTSHTVTIWRGLDRYDFTTEKAQVRGKSFDFIHMAGPDGSERLGFTTHLGAHWETWQVFRELYSNCLDEGGELYTSEVEPAEDHTTVWVHGAAFAEAARERHLYFLEGEPLYAGTLAEVHRGTGNGIYYRRVLVGRLPKAGAFTYILTAGVTLTEDRTLKDSYIAESWIGHTLAHCTDAAILGDALTATQAFEGGLSYHSPCTEFAEAVLDLCERKGTGAVAEAAVAAAETWAQREARVKSVPLGPRSR